MQPDQRRRPEDGRQGGEAGEGRGGVVGDDRHEDRGRRQQREALDDGPVAGQRQAGEGEGRADAELPGAGVEQEEGGLLPPARDRMLRQGEGEEADQGERDERPDAAGAGEQGEEEREEEVELLLDGERPGVEQRLEPDVGPEVVAERSPEVEVGDEERGGDGGARHLDEALRAEGGEARGEGRGHTTVRAGRIRRARRS